MSEESKKVPKEVGLGGGVESLLPQSKPPSPGALCRKRAKSFGFCFWKYRGIHGHFEVMRRSREIAVSQRSKTAISPLAGERPK